MQAEFSYTTPPASPRVLSYMAVLPHAPPRREESYTRVGDFVPEEFVPDVE